MHLRLSTMTVSHDAERPSARSPIFCPTMYQRSLPQGRHDPNRWLSSPGHGVIRDAQRPQSAGLTGMSRRNRMFRLSSPQRLYVKETERSQISTRNFPSVAFSLNAEDKMKDKRRTMMVEVHSTPEHPIHIDQHDC